MFVTPETILAAKAASQLAGVLEGRELARMFAWMRPNDLVWNYWVNNYLMGKDPFPFDLLYWNADSTRMPARMHSFYLRNMYIKNLLGVPGGIELAGVPIDLSKVKLPSYFISTVEDHIAPWKTTYKGARYLKGPVRFVLGGSGHIAGVVNPPAAGKYQYWTNDEDAGSLDEFISGATEHKGSWWPDWLAWLRKLTPQEVAATNARVPGKGKLKAIEDAPGRYVKAR